MLDRKMLQTFVNCYIAVVAVAKHEGIIIPPIIFQAYTTTTDHLLHFVHVVPSIFEEITQ